jgi:hypothetical protein
MLVLYRNKYACKVNIVYAHTHAANVYFMGGCGGGSVLYILSFIHLPLFAQIRPCREKRVVEFLVAVIANKSKDSN